MLRNEYRMASHRGLLTIVRNIRRGKPQLYKVFCMRTNPLHPFFSDILLILCGEGKLCPEC